MTQLFKSVAKPLAMAGLAVAMGLTSVVAQAQST